MGILEKISQMKQQGQTDPEIAENLKLEGISPKEIDEALSQSKVKSALTEQDIVMQQAQLPEQLTSEIPQLPRTEQMQPSMMQPIPQTQPDQEIQYPQEPQMPTAIPQGTIPKQTQPTEQAAYPEDYSAYQSYSPYPEYAPETNIETINEIADQIVEEKTNKLKKQITAVEKFKDEITSEIEKINKRLLKTESTLNELQMAIIGKVGEYGKDIQNISKEMHATQDSFSKILNPLTDNIRELQKITGSVPETNSRPRPKTKSKKSKKEKINFEDYLR